MKPELTILLPNYRTYELTKLCLRSLRLHTDLSRVRILAIDNASGDESLEYLRSIPWIDLIEQTPEELNGLGTGDRHAAALDLAMKQVDTEFVMSMHTDTIVLSDQWLDYLLARINENDRIAGVGSWKLEYVPWLKQQGKKIEDAIRILLGRQKKEFRFLRSHCALYRTELLQKYTRGFGDHECAGSSIHKCLLAAGYDMKFLPVDELCKYMIHLNHATLILNPVAGKGHKTNTQSAYDKLTTKINAAEFQKILNDDSLDHIENK